MACESEDVACETPGHPMEGDEIVGKDYCDHSPCIVDTVSCRWRQSRFLGEAATASASFVSFAGPPTIAMCDLEPGIVLSILDFVDVKNVLLIVASASRRLHSLCRYTHASSFRNLRQHSCMLATKPLHARARLLPEFKHTALTATEQGMDAVAVPRHSSVGDNARLSFKAGADLHSSPCASENRLFATRNAHQTPAGAACAHAYPRTPYPAAKSRRMHAHSCSRKQVHMHSAHSHAPKACPHSRVHKARAFTHTCNGTRALQLRQVSLFLADSGLYHDSVQILSHALSCEQDEARRADLRQALAQVQSQEQKARASGSYSRDFGREARMLWPSGGWSWG